MRNIKIVYSTSNDPWFNLSVEEYLLSCVQKDEVILYLWQNQNTIVIGKNQNPWKECSCDEFERNGGKLARRLSGGGAVFHDLGNLNFTFIMDKNLYDLNKQLSIILNSCKNLGINAEFTGRNDITVNGRKFSGNAFYFAKDSAYHHGTILIDTNFEKLTKYLQVSKEKIDSKGIKSVKSRVVNLKSIKKDLTVEKMMKELKQNFIKVYGTRGSHIIYEKCGMDEAEKAHSQNEERAHNKNGDQNTDKNVLKRTPSNINVIHRMKCEEIIFDYEKDISNPEINKLYKKYSSWEWRYGKSPKFDISYNKRFSWGEIDIRLQLKKAKIEKVKIFSDAMNAALIENISKKLKGIEFKKDAITKTIKSILPSNITNKRADTTDSMAIEMGTNMGTTQDKCIIDDICSLF